MARFYVSSSQIEGEDCIFLEGSDMAHFKNVLRAKKGDKCEIISSDGRLFRCAVTCFFENRIQLAVESVTNNDYEPAVFTTLYQGLPKGEKFELIIQKAVELGVNRIVPVIAERSVVKIKTDQDGEKKLQRWNRIAEEAAKQCGRGTLPQVLPPVKTKNIIFGTDTVKMLPYENETDRSVKSFLSSGEVREKALKWGLEFFVGPEGGIDPAEYDELTDRGFVPVTLGKRILRTETAPLMVLSSLRYEFED